MAAVQGEGEHAAAGPPEVPAAPEPERHSIPLTPNWDTALTYDVLDPNRNEEESPPVFVGRSELLGALVSAISQPDRRGTYLISGYRGTGKTSLVIEAARQARDRLPQDWHLLPLVLNVSEVSASLETASDVETQPLQIDARRLLTALLRAVRNSLPVVLPPPAQAGRRRASRAAPTVDPLIDKVVRASRKAEAAQYQEKEHERSEQTLTTTTEKKLSFEVANVFTLVGVLAGLAAIGLEGVLLLGTGFAALQVVAVALAGAGVFSFGRAYKATAATTQVGAAEIEVMRDNSLHQLESDLKDILADLERRSWRTIIILEELDKVDDAEGEQLEAVIRYFKNLFTQAPALFFFLTDKQYFDHVVERIAAARRDRTYAIEHTFFTHRVFVKRPAVEDCLAYLRNVFADEQDKLVIDAIGGADRLRTRRLASMSAQERFIRVLLFRANDHLFDLKNEMRRYVRVTGEGSVLEFDDDSLPADEQALAKFQFLIEQRARTYRFGGGRDYSNEILRNCITAVFDDLGSTVVQNIADFYPHEDEKLSLGEMGRVKEAVGSLVDDLQLGGAVIRVMSGSGTIDPVGSATFAWRDNATIAFLPVARLQPHEEALTSELSRLARIVAQFGPGGSLANLPFSVEPPDPSGVPQPLRAREISGSLLQSRDDFMQSEAPLDVEAAVNHRDEAERMVGGFVRAAAASHRECLSQRHGFALQPVTSGPDGGLWVARLAEVSETATAGGAAPPPPPVVLVYRPDRLQPNALNLLARDWGAEITRAAIVVVEDDPAAVDSPERRARWLGELDNTPWVDRTMVRLICLDEGLQPRDVAERWGDRAADELLLALLWVTHPGLPSSAEPSAAAVEPYRLRTSDGVEQAFNDLQSAVVQWWASPDRFLLTTKVAGIDLEAVERSLAGTQPNPAQPLAYVRATAVYASPPPGLVGVKSGLKRLAEAGRILLGIDVNADEALSDIPENAPPPGTRFIFVSSGVSSSGEGPLPGGLSTLRATSASDALRSLERELRGFNDAQADAFLRLLAEAGDVGAMVSLVVTTFETDPDDSRRWQKTLLVQGEHNALWHAAQQLDDVGRPGTDADRVADIYRELANRDYRDAMGRLVVLLAAIRSPEAGLWQQRFQEGATPEELARLADQVEAVDPSRAESIRRIASNRVPPAPIRVDNP